MFLSSNNRQKLDAKYLPDDVVGEQMDIVLTVDGQPGNAWYNTTTANQSTTISSGSIEAVMTAFSEHRIPKGKIIFYQNTSNENGLYGISSEIPAEFYFYGGDIWIGCVSSHPMYSNSLYKCAVIFNADGKLTRVQGYTVDMNQFSE